MISQAQELNGKWCVLPCGSINAPDSIKIGNVEESGTTFGEIAVHSLTRGERFATRLELLGGSIKIHDFRD